jgi:hypothetical protein
MGYGASRGESRNRSGGPAASCAAATRESARAGRDTTEFCPPFSAVFRREACTIVGFQRVAGEGGKKISGPRLSDDAPSPAVAAASAVSSSGARFAAIWFSLAISRSVSSGP